MLTDEDIKKIDTIVTKRVRQEVRTIVREEVKTELKTQLKPLKSDMAKLRKDMNQIVSFFDSEYLDLRKRVERLEEHLNLPPIT